MRRTAPVEGLHDPARNINMSVRIRSEHLAFVLVVLMCCQYGVLPTSSTDKLSKAVVVIVMNALCAILDVHV